MKAVKLLTTLVLCALCGGGPSPLRAAESDAQAAEKWKDLMSREDPAAARAAQEAVLAACGGRVEVLRKLIQADTVYERFPSGWQKSSLNIGEGRDAYAAEFFFRVPPGYDGGKPLPVLLSAHGTGGDGRGFGRHVESLLGPACDSYVLLCPTMPGPHAFNSRSYQEQAYLAPLAWLRRRLNVDDDRIYVTGYSIGGHMSWHLGTLFPQVFAAAVPMAGMPAFEGGPPTATAYFENLAHLPLWAIWGEKDRVAPPARGIADSCQEAAARLKELGNRNFTFTELPGVGHGNALPPPGRLAAYLATHKRTVAPARTAHLFHMPHHARCYYLQAMKFAHPPIDFARGVSFRLPPGEKPTEQLVDKMVRKESDRLMYRMYGEIDAAANTITVKAAGVSSVRVFVLQGMLDLDRPVKLRFWGRSWTGKVPASAACALAHYAATRDQTALVLNEIDVDINGRATVRYAK